MYQLFWTASLIVTLKYMMVSATYKSF